MTDIDAHTGFPIPKSDTAKELAPYLQAILMGQAAILERLQYTPYEDGDPLAKDEILDWLIATVHLKTMQKPVKRAEVRDLKRRSSGSSII
jgi:hypothetical protein